MEFSYPIPKQTEILGLFSKKWFDFVSRFHYRQNQNAGTKKTSFLMHFGADIIKEMRATNQLSSQDLSRFSAFVEYLEHECLFKVALCFLRYLFFNHNYETVLGIENYYTELKLLSTLCSFEGIAIENFIKNHIINCLHDEKCKEIFMTTSNVTARDMVDICSKAGNVASTEIFHAYLTNHQQRKSFEKMKKDDGWTSSQETRSGGNFDTNLNTIYGGDAPRFGDDIANKRSIVDAEGKYSSYPTSKVSFSSVDTFSNRNSCIPDKVSSLEKNFQQPTNLLPTNYCLPHQQESPMASSTPSVPLSSTPAFTFPKPSTYQIKPTKSMVKVKTSISEINLTTSTINSFANSSISIPAAHGTSKLDNESISTSVINDKSMCGEERETDKIAPTVRAFDNSEDASEIPQSYRCQQNAMLKTGIVQVDNGYEDVFTCNFCAYSCPGKAAIKEHLMQEHKSLKCFVCIACNTKFPSKEQFESHVRTKHMNIEEHTCPICDMVFSNKKILYGHLQGHTKTPTVQCRVCSAMFLKEKLLSDHMALVHPDTDRWSCTICDISFSTRRSLANHTEKLHKEKCEERARRLLCKPCGIHFTDKKSSDNHKRKFHWKPRIRKFPCNSCSDVCFSKSSLISHQRTHTGEKPFMCEVCGKEFSQLSTLQKHSHIHTGEKPYKCQYCNISFITSSNRLVHERGHRQERPYVCEQCSKAFRNSYDLKLHIRTHDEFRAKTFVCHCGTAFDTKRKLKRHEACHRGAKPYKCELCGACFTRPENVRGHQKSQACQKRLAKNSIELAS